MTQMMSDQLDLYTLNLRSKPDQTWPLRTFVKWKLSGMETNGNSISSASTRSIRLSR